MLRTGRRVGTMAFIALVVQRTHAWRIEGVGIVIVVGRSKQLHRTTTYSVILIVRGMTVATAAAQILLLQLPQQPSQLRPLMGVG
jgi:hypothetical protein